MNIKAFFLKVAAFFSSGAANKALNTAAALVPKAIPYLDIAAEIVAGITPTPVDDEVLAEIHAKFPRLFDGSLKSGDEVKLYLLGWPLSCFNRHSRKYPHRSLAPRSRWPTLRSTHSPGQVAGAPSPSAPSRERQRPVSPNRKPQHRPMRSLPFSPGDKRYLSTLSR
jgi:hypothetical protein